MDTDFLKGNEDSNDSMGDAVIDAVLVVGAVGLVGAIGYSVYKLWIEPQTSTPEQKPKKEPKISTNTLAVQTTVKLGEASEDTIVWLQQFINANFIATVSLSAMGAAEREFWNTKYLTSRVLDNETMQKFSQMLMIVFGSEGDLNAAKAKDFSLKEIFKEAAKKDISDILKTYSVIPPKTPPKDAARAALDKIPDFSRMVAPDPTVSIKNADPDTITWVQRFLNKKSTAGQLLHVDGKLGTLTVQRLGEYLQKHYPVQQINYADPSHPNSFLAYNLLKLLGKEAPVIVSEYL